MSWFGSQFVNGERALEWARDSTEPIDEAVVESKATEDDWTDLQRINAQLHVALVSLCKGEALTVVKNSRKGQGLDEWRRLYS